MAVQIDSPGQLQDILEVLSRRRWQVILPFLLVLVLGSAFAVLVPKKFEVTTEVELRETLVSEGGKDSESMATRDVHNAPLQIKSLNRIRATVEALGWEDYGSLRLNAEKNDYLKALKDNLTVRLPKTIAKTGSTFVTITFLHVDKQRALDFLLALRTLWIEEVVHIDRLAIDSKYEKLQELKRHSEEEIRREREALTQLRGAHSISPEPANSAGQSRREDRTFENLVEAQDLLEDQEELINESQDEITLIEERFDEVPMRISRETTVEGQSFGNKIFKLREDRVNLEVALTRYKPAHSKYDLILHKIKEIDEKILLLQQNRTEGSTESDEIDNPKYLKLEEGLATAERELEQLRLRRDRTAARVSELETQMAELQSVYGEIDDRQARIGMLVGAQNELELDLSRTRARRDEIKGPAGNPFVVTEEAQLPLQPTEPNPWLIVGFSLVAGLGLGLGTGMLLEFSKSSFRNPGDISRVMVVPVLGVVNGIVTRAQGRRRLLRRVSVGAVTMSVIGMVALITYAWALEPERLPAGVMDAIEDFRSVFR